MAGIKTNSNSITAILVEKLNYKKSGFRTAILKLWNLPDDIVFIDGTHSVSSIPEMENKEVDIIGKSGTKIKLLIEIKANLNEELQDSQKANGQYENTVKNHRDIQLKYIIPDGYYHQNELPKESEQIQIVNWSKIYEVAKETDNTGLTEQINYFVESNFNQNDLVLTKGDIAMFLSPSIIGKVISLDSKIENLLAEFIKENQKMISKNNTKKDDLGWWYTLYKGKKQFTVWIGLCELEEDNKNSFFIYTWIKSSDSSKYSFLNFENGKDYISNEYPEGKDVYIPITDKNSELPKFLFEDNVKDQQDKFNELMKTNIDKFFAILS